MFHYTKSFSTFATSYGMQEGSGLTGIYEGVVPVALVDDTSEFVKPTYPVYTGRGSRGAVTAVYSLVGIFCPPGGNPVRILNAFGESSVSMVWRLAEATAITANAGTFDPAGLPRGSAPTTQGLTGTTTVSPLTLDSNVIFYVSADDAPDLAGKSLRGIVLRPGEYLWTATTGANSIANASFVFEELTFPTPLQPAAI